MAAIRDIIENPHPIYNQNFNYWNFLLDSYEGGRDYTRGEVQKITNQVDGINVKVNGKNWHDKTLLNRNLFEHKKERTEDFQARVSMSFYYNFCAPIIDIYTNHLFKEPIIENFGQIEDDVDKQKNNIDRKQGSIIEVRKEIADLAQIYGHCFVVVDSPQLNMEIFSLQDKITNGAFPYFTIYHPQSILNWALDEFGRPYWVLIREMRDNNADPMMFDKDTISFTQYRLWTRQEWILYDEKFNEVQRGFHNLGRVPIVAAFDKPSRKAANFLGISAIADIAFIARDVYNLSSELRQIIRDQTFSMLAIQGEASDFNELVIATNKAILYPRETNPPQYVAPDRGPAEIIMKQIDNQISRMFQLAKLEGGSASFEGQSAVEQSGVSKAWDFNQTNATLSKKASNLEDAEQKLWDIWAAWEGKEFDGSISYPDEFSVSSLNQDLEESEKILKMNISQEFDKEVKRAIVRKKFPRLADEKEEIIDQQIEQALPQTGRLSDRLGGLLNRNGNSAGNNGGFVNGR